MQEPILKMFNICKSFPGVKALQEVSLEIYPGQVHALLGENGAGKSTLMKILGGIYQKDSGEIYLKHELINFQNPRHSQQKGISIIHQELSLIPYLSIAENIFLGREDRKKISGRIDWKKLHARARQYLEMLDIKTDPKQLVEKLGVGEQQMVEIARALSFESEVIIMDEPTAAITKHETEKLFAVIQRLKKEHKAIIFISHKLEEIDQICDQVTVLRDGKLIGTSKVAEVDQSGLIQMMVGRKIENLFVRKELPPGEEILRVEKLSKTGLINQISFSVHQGEVLGISGLMGSGRTELAKTIFGALKKDSGTFYIQGKEVVIKKPADAVKAGIAYASEDRKSEALFLELPIINNMTLVSLKKFLKAGLINQRLEKAEVKKNINQFNIKTPSIKQVIKNLSGGNQQKVVISKWLMINPRILILDEPTRGIDVGAKIEIYHLINTLKERGVAVIFISSEMPELLGISDRIIVIHEGRVSGEFLHRDATQEKITHCAFGLG